MSASSLTVCLVRLQWMSRHTSTIAFIPLPASSLLSCITCLIGLICPACLADRRSGWLPSNCLLRSLCMQVLLSFFLLFPDILLSASLFLVSLPASPCLTSLHTLLPYLTPVPFYVIILVWRPVLHHALSYFLLHYLSHYLSLSCLASCLMSHYLSHGKYLSRFLPRYLPAFLLPGCMPVKQHFYALIHHCLSA